MEYFIDSLSVTLNTSMMGSPDLLDFHELNIEDRLEAITSVIPIETVGDMSVENAAEYVGMPDGMTAEEVISATRDFLKDRFIAVKRGDADAEPDPFDIFARLNVDPASVRRQVAEIALSQFHTSSR